jgi:hypothetical protein
MREKNIKLYKFDELSKEAQEKTIEFNRYLHVDDCDWWQFREENFKDEMFDLGFEVSKIYFSGFGSQGDGACFEGSLDVTTWLHKNKLDKRYKKLYQICQQDFIRVFIKHSGHYYHENSMNFSYSFDFFEFKSSKVLEKQANEVLDLIEKQAREKASLLYQELGEEYDYLTSDEQLIEFLSVNDYKFLKEGGEIQ